jgi:hypothetical protein
METEAAPIAEGEDIIGTVLVDAQKVYEENLEDLKANNGVNIGTDYDQRETVDEGVMFKARTGKIRLCRLPKS